MAKSKLERLQSAGAGMAAIFGEKAVADSMTTHNDTQAEIATHDDTQKQKATKLNIYLDAETAEILRRNAGLVGTSCSKYICELIQHDNEENGAKYEEIHSILMGCRGK